MTSFFNYDQEKKKLLTESLAENLAVLRAKAGISQEQLAAIVDVSRQTYGAIETRKRPISWSVYMALILYFNSNKKTKEMLHTFVVVPDEIMESIE